MLYDLIARRLPHMVSLGCTFGITPWIVSADGAVANMRDSGQERWVRSIYINHDYVLRRTEL